MSEEKKNKMDKIEKGFNIGGTILSTVLVTLQIVGIIKGRKA